MSKKSDIALSSCPINLIVAWPPHSIADLTAENLQLIIDLRPSIVLLGSGENLAFPDPMLLNPFYQQKIGIEVMNNGAACRTYSVLMSEGRSVAAALLIA